MATEKIALGINLRKNKVQTSAGYGKYDPEVDTQKTLSPPLPRNGEGVG